MTEDLQVIELQETYRQADVEGREKMVAAAAQLLNAQKTLEKEKREMRTEAREEGVTA